MRKTTATDTPFPFALEKQMVSGARGVVAANHPLGSAAGIEMLALGGNAIDAAIATLFALNVVEPMMVGVFGAGWTNLRLADGTQIVLDNYSTAPFAGSNRYCDRAGACAGLLHTTQYCL